MTELALDHRLAGYRLGSASLSITLCLIGCAATAGTRGKSRLEASSEPYATDLPVPIGFRITDRASEDWSNGPVRYLRHRYEGMADKYRVRRFYREQMPLARWSPAVDRMAGPLITMRFERDAETCTITIRENNAWLGRHVTVDAIIEPSRP